jgi:hypothetical protein
MSRTTPDCAKRALPTSDPQRPRRPRAQRECRVYVDPGLTATVPTRAPRSYATRRRQPLELIAVLMPTKAIHAGMPTKAIHA